MSEDRVQATSAGPLKSLDEWDDFVKDRYAEAAPGSGAKPFVTVNPNKKKEEFRNYEAEARACVKEFYRLNHTYQTREFVLQKKEEYLQGVREYARVWKERIPDDVRARPSQAYAILTLCRAAYALKKGEITS